MIVGLTGSIGTGKSTVSKILKECGCIIKDADKIAGKLSERPDIVDIIGLEFGKNLIDENHKIKRKELREIVFSDKNKLQALNEIMHPKIIEEFKKIKENSDKSDIIIFDVPLLFEVGMDKMCDKIIVVSIPLDEQITRIIKRDNVTKELAKKIIDSQMSLDEKIKRSQINIDNSGNLEELNTKVRKVYRDLKGE